MIEQWSGVLNHFSGFENNELEGTGFNFNWILSNGHRSQQRDANYPTKYTFMMPEGSHKMIRSVNIHYGAAYITGFSFFDKEGALLYKIGYTTYSRLKVKIVLLAENEVIIGVVAKLWGVKQSRYTDFQFQITTRKD